MIWIAVAVSWKTASVWQKAQVAKLLFT